MVRLPLLLLRWKMEVTSRVPSPKLRYWTMAVAFMAMVAFCGTWSYHHWTDPDREIKLFNFLVAWWPFAISIFVAFIPDIEKLGHAVTWRVGIIVLGLGYSAMLWHQQSLQLAAARKDQENIVSAAVQKSNAHADNKIGEVQKGLSDVQKGLTDGVKHSDEQIGALSRQIEWQVAKSTSDLGNSISKVGKPDPPERVRIGFSIYREQMLASEFPITSEVSFPNSDGNITIRFNGKNISHSTAENLELWLLLCDACEFASEPVMFDFPAGTVPFSRHRLFGLLAQGVSTSMMEAKVRPPRGAKHFDFVLRYTCKACGTPNDEAQVFRITIIEPFNRRQ